MRLISKRKRSESEALVEQLHIEGKTITKPSQNERWKETKAKAEQSQRC
jgi:hypothetical protein